MQLGLRAKLTIVITALVLLTTAVLTMVFLELLMQQVLHDIDQRAQEREIAAGSNRHPQVGHRRGS